MAQFDVRFAKKVNRIQQAMIQELNKMGMIHLFMLGYSAEDVTNFTLTLTNPSTQLDLLKSELLREKAQTYTELTRGENGIAAWSHTRAKRIVFNMSDNEIIEDLKQQKMEKVVMQEFADAPITIKKTGLFKDLDDKYVDQAAMAQQQMGGGQQQPPAMGGAPAGGGGMPPSNQPPAMGGETPPPAGGELPPLAESREMSISRFNDFIDNAFRKDVVVNKSKSIMSEQNNSINIETNKMINEIDTLINKANDIENNDDSDDDIINNIDEITIN